MTRQRGQGARSQVGAGALNEGGHGRAGAPGRCCFCLLGFARQMRTKRCGRLKLSTLELLKVGRDRHTVILLQDGQLLE